MFLFDQFMVIISLLKLFIMHFILQIRYSIDNTFFDA
jgi:hypothetical protein